jgi:hypothetical protein
MEYVVYASENLLTKGKFLDAERQVGNKLIVVKGGTINGYD